MTAALACGEAQGLPPLPSRWQAAIAEVAPCCQERQFVYFAPSEPKFLDVEPLVEAGVWMLDRIAPDVADHYVRHLAGEASPSSQEFVRRLRADLRATTDVVVETA